MSREAYLNELRGRLSGRMSPQELENVLRYYDEYFDEAGPEREGEVIAELGSPERLSRVIMGDKVLEELEGGRYEGPEQDGRQAEDYPPRSEFVPPRRGLSTLWTVLLALCAAPIAIPLIVAVVAVVVAVMVAVFAVVFGVGLAGVICIGAGIFAAVSGISAIFSAGIGTTMFFVGGGLLSAGVGLLLIAGVVALAGLCFKGLARMIGRMIRGRSDRV